MGLSYALDRYHRIGSPTDAARVEHDRPMECALCHADKSVRALLGDIQRFWGKTYDQASLRGLYGSLDANVFQATLERGMPHEQAVVIGTVAAAVAKSEPPVSERGATCERDRGPVGVAAADRAPAHEPDRARALLRARRARARGSGGRAPHVRDRSRSPRVRDRGRRRELPAGLRHRGPQGRGLRGAGGRGWPGHARDRRGRCAGGRKGAAADGAEWPSEPDED